MCSKLKIKCVKYSWIIRNIIFLILFAYLFVSVSYVLRPLNLNRNNIIGFYEEEKELDVVCVGGSSTYRYWMALTAWQEYGFASYSFAHSSMIAESVLISVQEVLKEQSPEVLVIDLRLFAYMATEKEEVWLRNTIDNITYSFSRLNLILNVVPEHIVADDNQNILDYIFDITKYHENWKTIDSNQILSYNNKIRSDYKGYDFLSTGVSVESVYDNAEITKVTIPNDYIKQLFDDLLAYLNGIESEVLFVVSPYNETPDDRAVYNYYEQLIIENGFNYLNTNKYLEQMDLSELNLYLYDNHHVNIFGAEKYTSFLAQYLTDNYDLPDRRNDSLYEDWNQDYIAWEIDVEKTKEETLALRNENE